MKRFQNILFVKSVDHNKAALAQAVALARNNQAYLTLVATLTETPEHFNLDSPGDMEREVRLAAFKSCQTAIEDFAEFHKNSVQIETKVLEGIPFLAIIQEVLQNGYDLLIKTVESDEGPMSHFFNTTDMHLLRKCPCPVWLIKPDQSKKLNRIVAAVDFDEAGNDGKNAALNRQILEMAISLANQESAELHVVHAWQAIAESALSSLRSGLTEMEVDKYIADVKASREHRLSKLLNQARSWVGQDVFDSVELNTYATNGRAEQVVADLIQTLEADLLVMGTVGRTGIPGFFIGNTAETILNNINCSVLALKPAGFVTPVELPAHR